MLALADVRLSVGGFALRGVDLAVARGEYFVLMGPTGSGKSLTIQCICGLIRPDAGSITIAGRDVTGLGPRQRRVGYVPQDSGLLPHLSVADNIAFPLRRRGQGARQARRAIEPIVQMLGAEALLDRRPGTLSGGERQKVALARALAAQPDVLLLDEPVSALDEPTRREVCAQLLAVQRRIGLATVHVCHNTEEARTLADRVGVMHEGRIVQTGRLEELEASPADPAISRLLGV